MRREAAQAAIGHGGTTGSTARPIDPRPGTHQPSASPQAAGESDFFVGGPVLVVLSPEDLSDLDLSDLDLDESDLEESDLEGSDLESDLESDLGESDLGESGLDDSELASEPAVSVEDFTSGRLSVR